MGTDRQTVLHAKNVFYKLSIRGPNRGLAIPKRCRIRK